MRLIDADALTQELEKGIIIPDDLYTLGIMEGNDHAIKKVSEAPTIDVQPVRRGEWEDDKLDVYWHNSFIHKRCSKCGAEPHKNRDHAGRIMGYILSHFCPNCGADMRRNDG